MVDQLDVLFDMGAQDDDLLFLKAILTDGVLFPVIDVRKNMF